MPELPEVETVKRTLEHQLKERKIISVQINRPEIIAHPSSAAFTQNITGQKIAEMGRRGKFLSICLENGDTIWLHLRMTGRLLVTPPDFPKEAHTHLVFCLDDGMEIRFMDTRRFGRFWLLKKGEEDTFTGMNKLGPEPLGGILTAEWLEARIGKRKKSIKECLLDQSVVAGIGNIHGDEILFCARICPGRPAFSLKKAEWQRLVDAIVAMLKKGIEDNRMTPQEYLEGRGKGYRMAPFLQVYGQDGQPCPRCKTILRRIVLSGRSSVYCPECQKEDTI